MRSGRWLVLGFALVTTGCARLIEAGTRPAAPPAQQVGQLLVPYVSQSELLCGGAAIAMIERWWGRRGVYAEEFASLVRPAEGGIRTTDMETVVRSRGWATEAMSSTPSAVQKSVADSVPVIALIQVARNRYHYIVIVAWSNASVTYHDPAVSPSETVDAREFLRRWDGAKRWAMFVRPALAVSAPTSAADGASRTPVTPPFDSLPCRPFLDQATDAAAANRLEDADRLLAQARGACPGEPLTLRELAGVRFRQGNHAEAARLAGDYTQRVATDSLGWQLLASSRYLARDLTGALQAWNVIGRPTVDLLRIDGSGRTRYRILADGMDVTPGALLTARRYALAERRIADVPSLSLSRVSYDAVGGGTVEVRAAVVERKLVDPLARLLVVEASRAAFTRQVFLNVSTPLRLGELWTAHWRWRNADPRFALRVDIPARIIAPTVVRFERSWERFRFSSGIAEEQRGASAVSVGGWVRPSVELRVGSRFERWSIAGDYVALHAGGAVHRADDRLSLIVDAEHAIPVGGSIAYDRVTNLAAWTLPADRWSNTWSMRLGSDWNSASAPRGLWPIAGGGLMRAIPLRAHPLIIDNLLPAERTARLIVHGGLAGDRTITTVGQLALGAGVFLDGAHIPSPGDGSGTSRLYLDGGAGVRASLVGVPWAAVRVDVARGLGADRRWGLTAAFLQTLPVRLGRER